MLAAIRRRLRVRGDGPEAHRRTDGADAIHRLIDERAFTVLFQPVVELCSGWVLAYEAVTRPGLDAFDGAESMVAAAVAERRIGELGRLIRAAAIEAGADHPLFLNVDPNELAQPWLVQPDDPLFFHDHPLHVEITESAPLDYFEQCRSVLDELRSKDVGLVIDDLGSGYSNLRHIADLDPAYVKLDRAMLQGLAPESARFRLLRSLSTLCSEMGAEVVAEGIETVEQLEAAREVGIRYGQGFLLGRPAARPEPRSWPDEVPFLPRTEVRIVSDLPADYWGERRARG
jgi:EAL domain-containing protein (putative c-di-GMP-specific phosphodiesterase class I)